MKLTMFRRFQRRKTMCLEVRETLDLQKLLNPRYVQMGHATMYYLEDIYNRNALQHYQSK